MFMAKFAGNRQSRCPLCKSGEPVTKEAIQVMPEIYWEQQNDDFMNVIYEKPSMHWTDCYQPLFSIKENSAA